MIIQLFPNQFPKNPIDKSVVRPGYLYEKEMPTPGLLFECTELIKCSFSNKIKLDNLKKTRKL